MSIDLAAIRAEYDATFYRRYDEALDTDTYLMAREYIPQLLAEIERLRALVGPEASPAAGEVTG